MTKTARGHWNGDPNRHCEALSLTAESAAERETLALLNRVCADPEQFARLVAAAESIEAEAVAALDPAFS